MRALAAAAASLEAAASSDPLLGALAERARGLAIEGADLAAEIRSYGEGLEAAPNRLDAVEERLGAISRLERKHGGSDRRRPRARRGSAASAATSLRAPRSRWRRPGRRSRRHSAAHAKKVAALSAARAAAAPALAAAVGERLGALAMADAGFAVTLVGCEPGRAGAEHAQFELAPNPGVPAAPLRDIASGGELSRVMLALLGAAHGAAGAATLVFDEIDAGIGGHTARAVADPAARARRRAPGPGDHPPGGGRLGRLAPLHDRQAVSRRRHAHDGHAP